VVAERFGDSGAVGVGGAEVGHFAEVSDHSPHMSSPPPRKGVSP
jgi:hypothetical protein